MPGDAKWECPSDGSMKSAWEYRHRDFGLEQVIRCGDESGWLCSRCREDRADARALARLIVILGLSTKTRNTEDMILGSHALAAMEMAWEVQQQVRQRALRSNGEEGGSDE